MDVDALVVGAGFGGLGAALGLAERGAKVLVCEALTYPGGCAATFGRGGYRFDAGATLSAGLGEGQLLRRWIDEHRLDVPVRLLDPVLTLRGPGLGIDIPRDRAAFIESLCARPDVPEASARAFFALQRRVADALWPLLDQPALLPPLTARNIRAHLARLPALLPLARWAGRPLDAVLRAHGLDHCRPVRTLADALCQITVQCDASEADALFAMAALDYPFRGAAHVAGGLGTLANGLAEAIRAAGGDVRYATRVKRLTRTGAGYAAVVRGGEVRAGHVFANLLPHDLIAMLGRSVPALERRARRVETGWGAVALYLGLRADGLPSGAHHLEIVQEPGGPLPHGNHMLVSIGDEADPRAPAGQRVATVSTHVDLATLGGDPAPVVAGIQERMRHGLRLYAPEVAERIVHEETASPRTYQRFTRRHRGYVGGVPRRAGVSSYLDVLPPRLPPGLTMLGDSVLLGQSVLATSASGYRLAHHAVDRGAVKVSRRSPRRAAQTAGRPRYPAGSPGGSH